MHCQIIKFFDASDKCIVEFKYQLNRINLINWPNKTHIEAFRGYIDQFKDA